jgi:hypothetical protein
MALITVRNDSHYHKAVGSYTAEATLLIAADRKYT